MDVCVSQEMAPTISKWIYIYVQRGYPLAKHLLPLGGVSTVNKDN